MVKIRFARLPTARVRTTHGFTYLTALFIVAILAGGLVLVGEVWHTFAMREKEVELLWIGHQYRKAIGAYYEATPGNVKRYPRTLEDLLKDGRGPGTERHLRKRYPDPITGKNEWGLVKAPDGGILGVYSLSTERPLKTAHFRVRDAAFEDTQKYWEWAFVHTPPAQPARKQNAKPAAK
jgi:hypothetical protein